MKIRAWSSTDTGLRRQHNEDSLACEPTIGLFAVADGMGGHQAGDRASQLVIETLRDELAEAKQDFDAAAKRLLDESRQQWFTIAEDQPGDVTAELRIDSRTRDLIELSETAVNHPVKAVMRLAARKAGAAVFAESIAKAASRGMGTTLTAILVDDDRAYLVHVGDSRAYRFRDNCLEQLTEDHTWIAEQVKEGLLSDEEAATSKFRHVITRSIGFESDVRLDSAELSLEAGDCFVICSDGLTNYVENDELEEIVINQFYSDLPGHLIELAKERGGDDNITAVVFYAANTSVDEADLVDSKAAETDNSEDADSGEDAESGGEEKTDS